MKPRINVLIISLFSCLIFTSCSHQNTIYSDYWRKQFPQYQYINLSGIDTRYLVTGKGPPLILLHGIFWGYGMFDQNIPELAKHFTVYAFDLRGMGYSAKPDDLEYSLWTQFLHLIQFMEAFHLEKASIWGHSIGGIIALQMALYMPNRVDHLILSDVPFQQTKLPNPYMTFMSVPVLGKLAEWFPLRLAVRSIFLDAYEHDDQTDINKKVDEVHRLVKRPGGIHALRQWIRTLPFKESPAVETNYGKIKTPTLIMWGEKDAWFPVTDGQKLHQVIPGSKLMIFPNVGHQVLEEAPQEVNQAVIGFLSAPKTH